MYGLKHASLDRLFSQSPLYQKVFQELETFFPSLPSSLAVGVSGGADSLLLTLFLKKWTQEKGVIFYAVHVNHNLRANASQEAYDLQQALQKWDISLKILSWEHQGVSTRIQEKARQARYQLIQDFCQQQGCAHLFLAHHLDDQIETCLMRLMRGSGLKGLQGMAFIEDWGPIKLVRPFLEVPKSDLVEALEKEGISYFEDPSNENPAFTRVRWRKGIQQALQAEERSFFKRSLEKLREAEDAVAYYAQKALTDHVVFSPLGFATCSFSLLADAFPLEIQYRTLESLLSLVGGNDRPPRRASLKTLLTWLKGPAEPGIKTLAGCEIKRAKEKILFYREISALEGEVNITPLEKKVWDKRYYIDNIKEELMNISLSIEALTPKDIKSLRDNKVDMDHISNKLLLSIPALKANGDVLSVPLLGYNPESVRMRFIGGDMDLKKAIKHEKQ